MTAIAMALQQLYLRPTAFKKAVLLVYAKSAIQTVASKKQATTQTVKSKNNKNPQQTRQDSSLSVGPLTCRNTRK